MNKSKWILRTITICCVILPILFTVLAYHDNLIGLIVPPEITAAISGKGQNIQEVLLPDFSDISNLEPTFNSDFRFNPEDGTYGFSINLTSPLDTPVTLSSFSLIVTDENETFLGSINLGSSVTLIPSKNSRIPVEGGLSQELVTLLQNNDIDPNDPNFNLENLEEIGLDINNIQLTNVNIDVGGIQIHIDELSPNELLGFLESG